MKKTMEQQLKEILAVTEEQQGLKGQPKEVQEINRQIKIWEKTINIFTAITVIGIAGMLFGIIAGIIEYVGSPSPENLEEIYICVLYLIQFSAMLIMTMICKNMLKSMKKSGTPFIPQIPSGMRKLSAVMVVALMISVFVYLGVPKILGTEIPNYNGFFTNGTCVYIVAVLIFLSSIFDYGCKLQKESDETL